MSARLMPDVGRPEHVPVDGDLDRHEPVCKEASVRASRSKRASYCRSGWPAYTRGVHAEKVWSVEAARPAGSVREEKQS
jgi:hypothetical protein